MTQGGAVPHTIHCPDYDIRMTDEEAVMTLAVITTAAREKTGLTRGTAADRMRINYRTLGTLERGELGSSRGPLASTLRAVEGFYGWKPDSMHQFWQDRRSYKFGTVTEALFAPDPEPEPTGLIKAAHLTDEELMNELSFRFLMRDRRQFDDHE